MLVIDTSIAVKWVIPEDGSGIERGTDDALALLSEVLVAPDCIRAEFANAMFKKVQRGEISAEQARASTAILPDAVTFLPSVPLIDDALAMALSLPHPVHDCIFLIAAMNLKVSLVTADAKFHANCQLSGQDYPVLLLGAAR